jgi:hypothetical protein
VIRATSFLSALLLLAAAPARAAEPARARFRIEPSGRGPQRLDTPAAFASASAGGDDSLCRI